jgi:ribose 5-phosphate isomerase B
MRIVIGSIAKGLALKNAVRECLERNGHEILDVGCYDGSGFTKFPAIAERAAALLQRNEADRAILCCGSGMGMALAAGKFAGICAVSCESPLAAEFARKVNDANVLCMGEHLVAHTTGCRIAEVFLDTHFQDVPDMPAQVVEFFAEARAEIMSRGDIAADRDIETVAFG